jgi:hypothetical protein
LDHQKTRDEIIKFVIDSPEEVNSRVAVFIAGMLAQKNLMAGRKAPAKRSLSVKTDQENK